MGQIKFISSMIMIGLFSIAIVVFAIQFGVDNESAVLLGDDPEYAKVQNNLVGDIQTFRDDSNSSITTAMTSTQEAGDQSASSGGQFKVGVGTAISVTTTVITLGFNKIFGIDTGFGIFLTAITSLLVWIGGLYIWKTIRGNPD